jgi:CO/xanthine dehydrogenase Mo-binding subunit
MAIETVTPEAPPEPAKPLAQERPAHRDFLQKVAGTLPYADDWGLPGMLHGVVVRAQVPSARLIGIGTTAALAVPGVRAVLTAEDVPRNAIIEEASGLGIEPAAQPVLAADRIRYDGEPVALVAAETPGGAVSAAELVEVEYEEEEGVFDPEEALQPGAPLLHPGGNCCAAWRFAEGDVEAAFRSADVVVEETYRTQRVDHVYLEPEAGVGWVDSDGVVTLRVSTQVIEHARELAEILGLPHSRLRVIASYMGGGFGGKEDMTVEPFLALLVWRTGRPVRMVFSRQESLQARQKRHPFVMRYRTGARRDGTIVAQDIRILGDAGAYPLLSSRVLFAAGVNATGPYRFGSARVESLAAFTNSVPTSAMRGFGAMQVVFAYESQLDRLADELGMDRVYVRERNFVKCGEQRATGETIDTGVGVGECLQHAVAALGERSESLPGRRIGRGVACSMQPYGRSVFFSDRASSWIGLERDGTVVVRAGVTDLGAGQAASLGDIVGEVLGVTVDRTTVHIGDSALTPLTGGTFATRQLYMSGNAALKVARVLRGKLEPIAAALLSCAPEELEFAENRVAVGTDASQSITIAELARAAEDRGVMPFHHDTFIAETGQFDMATGRGRSFPDYTYGAHAVEIEVDEETGQVRILRYVACHDVGRVIDLGRVEGQIHGAVAQGIGYALAEEVELEEGVVTSTLFADYLMPTAPDLPEIEAVALELYPGKGPFGARGIGEPPIGPPAPALASAIEDAVGVRLRGLPMSPERIYAALRQTAPRPARSVA